jgi:ribosomal protein L31E
MAGHNNLFWNTQAYYLKMVKAAKSGEERTKSSDIVTREYTIHMSKRLYGVTFKKRAPRAIREIRQFAERMMKTA